MQRNWVFLITIIFETKCCRPQIFQTLWILLDQIIWVWNIKGLQHLVLNILRFKYLILFQRLNSFAIFEQILKVYHVKDLYLHNKEIKGREDPPPQTILGKPDVSLKRVKYLKCFFLYSFWVLTTLRKSMTNYKSIRFNFQFTELHPN